MDILNLFARCPVESPVLYRTEIGYEMLMDLRIKGFRRANNAFWIIRDNSGLFYFIYCWTSVISTRECIIFA